MKQTILLQQISEPMVQSNMSVYLSLKKDSLVSECLLGKLDHVHFLVDKNSGKESRFSPL